jgi:hypothetical protein
MLRSSKRVEKGETWGQEPLFKKIAALLYIGKQRLDTFSGPGFNSDR